MTSLGIGVPNVGRYFSKKATERPMPLVVMKTGGVIQPKALKIFFGFSISIPSILMNCGKQHKSNGNVRRCDLSEEAPSGSQLKESCEETESENRDQ